MLTLFSLVLLPVFTKIFFCFILSLHLCPLFSNLLKHTFFLYFILHRQVKETAMAQPEKPPETSEEVRHLKNHESSWSSKQAVAEAGWAHLSLCICGIGKLILLTWIEYTIDHLIVCLYCCGISLIYS